MSNPFNDSNNHQLPTINGVHDINAQSWCTLSGPPCIFHYTVRPNKKETGIVSYFSKKGEEVMVNDIYHFKVQLIFSLLTPFMTRKSHA